MYQFIFECIKKICHAVSPYLAKQRNSIELRRNRKWKKIILERKLNISKKNRCNCKPSQMYKKNKQTWCVYVVFSSHKVWSLAWQILIPFVAVQYLLTLISLAIGWIWMQQSCTSTRTSQHTLCIYCSPTDNEHSITNAFYMNGQWLCFWLCIHFMCLYRFSSEMISTMRIIRAIEIEMIKFTYHKIVEKPNRREKEREWGRDKKAALTTEAQGKYCVCTYLWYMYWFSIFSFTLFGLLSRINRSFLLLLLFLKKRPPILLTAINTIVATVSACAYDTHDAQQYMNGSHRYSYMDYILFIFLHKQTNIFLQMTSSSISGNRNGMQYWILSRCYLMSFLQLNLIDNLSCFGYIKKSQSAYVFQNVWYWCFFFIELLFSIAPSLTFLISFCSLYWLTEC